MSRLSIVHVFRFAVCLTLMFMLAGSSGCGSSQPAGGAPVNEVAYVCTETKEVFRLPPQSPPVVNPKTGKPTLVPGLYCSKCDKWYPTPPLNAVGGNAGALNCPVHHTPLVLGGAETPAAAPEETP